jgi:hypothetical protein
MSPAVIPDSGLGATSQVPTISPVNVIAVDVIKDAIIRAANRAILFMEPLEHALT